MCPKYSETVVGGPCLAFRYDTQNTLLCVRLSRLIPFTQSDLGQVQSTHNPKPGAPGNAGDSADYTAVNRRHWSCQRFFV